MTKFLNVQVYKIILVYIFTIVFDIHFVVCQSEVATRVAFKWPLNEKSRQNIENIVI